MVMARSNALVHGACDLPPSACELRDRCRRLRRDSNPAAGGLKLRDVRRPGRGGRRYSCLALSAGLTRMRWESPHESKPACTRGADCCGGQNPG